MHTVSRRRLMAAGAASLSALSAACATQPTSNAAPPPPSAAPPPTPPTSTVTTVAPPPVSAEQVQGAEALAQISYTDAERTQLIATIADQLNAIRALRAISKPNDLAPAQVFDPRIPGVCLRAASQKLRHGARQRRRAAYQ